MNVNCWRKSLQLQKAKPDLCRIIVTHKSTTHLPNLIPALIEIFKTDTMKLIFILPFLFITHFSFSQTDSAIQKTTFTIDNYKIQYPKDWRLDTSKAMGTELFLFSPLENDTDKFSENVNIIIQDLGGQNIDLEKYKKITDRQITEIATDSKVYESLITEIDNKEYFKITYAMTQGKFRLKITSLCFIKNDKAYLATFGSEFDKYDQYKKIGEEILSSFCLTK